MRWLARGRNPINPTIAILLLLGAWRSYGCSMLLIPPIKVDPEETVFIGSVVGLDERIAMDGKLILGVRVRVRESILAPTKGKRDEYIVYPFWLGADCSRIPVTKDWLFKEYPLGKDVWVIGSRPEFGESEGALEAWEGSDSYIADNESRPATAEAIFDYRGTSGPLVPEFELRKDLLRLKGATSLREKERILKRVAFHPFFRGQEDHFRWLAEYHLKTETSVGKVMRFYEKRVKNAASQGLKRMPGGTA